MIRSLNHLTLATSDLSRSFDFYVELLGARPEARWDAGAYLSVGELWLCLSSDDALPARDYTHVAFGVEPGGFARAVATLRAAGVVEWKANSSEGGSFYFLDPDGHRLEIHEGDLSTRLEAVARRPYSGWRRFDAPDDAGQDALAPQTRTRAFSYP